MSATKDAIAQIIFPVAEGPDKDGTIVDATGKPVAIITDKDGAEFFAMAINTGVMLIDAADKDVRQLIEALNGPSDFDLSDKEPN